MYWFVSVAITPVRDPDIPMTTEEWQQSVRMLVARMTEEDAQWLHESLLELGYVAVPKELVSDGISQAISDVPKKAP